MEEDAPLLLFRLLLFSLLPTGDLIDIHLGFTSEPVPVGRSKYQNRERMLAKLSLPSFPCTSYSPFSRLQQKSRPVAMRIVDRWSRSHDGDDEDFVVCLEKECEKEEKKGCL